MLIKKYYEIDRSCYLFEKQESPEEKIRQWALFELMSNYGVNLKNIQVETPVKVGSKNYRADIVIMRDSFPFVVVECKENSFVDINSALEQSISYANFLKAEFVVFTNGDKWVVKRLIQGKWHPVSDIPGKLGITTDETLTEWLTFLDSVKPILFWTHRQVPLNYAYKFLDYLQRFFARGAHLEGHDHDLLTGTEFLLRVIAGGTDQTELGHKIEHYETSTFQAAYKYFQRYFQRIGSTALNVEYIDLMDFRGLFSTLWDGFEELVKAQKNIELGDINLARLNLSLLQYFHKILDAGYFEKVIFKDIPSSVVYEFAKFIELILLSKLGLRLPSPLDTVDIETFRIITCNDWVNKNGELP
jgi:hypothetical protein